MSYIRSYLPETVNNNFMYYVGALRYYVQPYISNTFTANQITSNIFLGDIASAFNEDALKEQGITHILSIFNGAQKTFPDSFTYKIIHINDDAWVNIREHFDESNQFIDDALKNPENKILIHCQRGVSRSVTLLIAYLLWKKNSEDKIDKNNVDDAIEEVISYVKEQRSIANPNLGFVKCLKSYIYELNNYDMDDKYDDSD